MARRPTSRRGAAVLVSAALLSLGPPAGPHGTALRWDHLVWRVTNGQMAGVAPGRPANVTVDRHGFLHLRIARSATGATAAELFTTNVMGFGTYQWQVQGAVFALDPAALGLFPYGPEAGIGRDGEDEIDVEFSRWNGTLCAGRCNADFTVYPATGHLALGPSENDFAQRAAGHTLVTARVTWLKSSITETVMSGLQPLSSTTDVLHTWRFAPSDYTARIPQRPLPVGMNLWCFERLPATSQQVVLRQFQYVAHT